VPLERAQQHHPLDLGVHLDVEVVDPEFDEVAQVALAELRACRRTPRDGERMQSVFEAGDDLPVRVLAAADRNDAVPLTVERADAVDDLGEALGARGPVDLAAGLSPVRTARGADAVVVDRQVRTGVREDAVLAVAHQGFRGQPSRPGGSAVA
jgi:hypothetical protein